MQLNKRIAILLCTYNGSRFLRKQLDSIINQSHHNWVIFASDDASTDNTLEILSEYHQKLGKEKFIILKGPKKGFAWNFLSLLANCSDDFDYYAFCDQDDEWVENKLYRGLQYLNSIDSAAVYCGRTMLIDEKSECIGFSPLFLKPPSFRNALVQNIAGGNTMILNQHARNLINKTPKWDAILFHDWWVYILITGCGGVIYYDHEAMVKYRQHSGNMMGSNIFWQAKFKRIASLTNGQFKAWIKENINTLTKLSPLLLKENKEVLDKFNKARRAGFLKRIYKFSTLKIYRQTLLDTIIMTTAAILKKI